MFLISDAYMALNISSFSFLVSSHTDVGISISLKLLKYRRMRAIFNSLLM